MNRMTKLLLASTLALALLAAVGAAGLATQFAFAQTQAVGTPQAPSAHGGDFHMPFGKAHGFGGGCGLLSGQAVLDAAAKTLGMSSDDLLAELRSGKTLADVAQEKNVDVNTLKQSMVDAAKAQVDQQQQAGQLTQEQADQLKQRIDAAAATLDLSQPYREHGRGHWGGPFDKPGEPSTPQTPVAPTNAPSGGGA